MADMPVTHYVKSDDVHIAYQVIGEGPRDLLFVPGFVSNVEAVWQSPVRAAFLALTREATRSRPARLKWSHLLNTSATTLRRYSLNILKELGKQDVPAGGKNGTRIRGMWSWRSLAR